MDSLAVSRGLLTCSQPHILLSPPIDGKQVSQVQAFKPVSSLLCFCKQQFGSFQMGSLLEGLFPLVYDLCQKKMDCLYLAFEGE